MFLIALLNRWFDHIQIWSDHSLGILVIWLAFEMNPLILKHRYMDDQNVTTLPNTMLLAQYTQMLAQHRVKVEPILSIASLFAGELLCEFVSLFFQQ